jgi:YihY family inner membrane protein
MERILRALDRSQQGHAWLAFPFAVFKKFGDDRAGNLAALIAYYGFFSLFPLLLAFVTILGFALEGDPQLRERIVDSTLAQFPVIGADIKENIGTLQGSGLVLAIGLIGAIWSGLAVVRSSQMAMDDVWDVPRVERKGFVPSVLRAMLTLVVFGLTMLLSSLLASLGAASGLAPALRALVLVASVFVNFLLFATAFHTLTVADVSWRDVVPGAIGAALAWALLQFLGTFLVDRTLRNAGDVYGFFAIVIGLLSWIYLAAQITLLAAEVNVVKARKLWPRSLVQPPLVQSDKRVLAGEAEQERRRPEQSVEVRFGDSDRGER